MRTYPDCEGMRARGRYFAGRLLAVRVHAADVQDRDGAKLALKASRATFPFVQTVFADGG